MRFSNETNLGLPQSIKRSIAYAILCARPGYRASVVSASLSQAFWSFSDFIALTLDRGGQARLCGGSRAGVDRRNQLH